MNKKILFNDGWEFSKSEVELNENKDLIFEPIDIPHDWLIYNTLNLYENSIGWYRRKYNYINLKKQIFLYFEGVYMDSSLYVNGKLIGEWKYGYSSFEYDITKALIEGENEILVKVIHQSPNSRWYSGAGIYRNIWLKERNKNYIISDGIYITTRKKEKQWEVEVDTTIKINQRVEISHIIMDKDAIISSSKNIIEVEDANIYSRTDRQKLLVENPLLWSTDKPNLYKIITILSLVGDEEKVEEIERIKQNLGFKEVILDPDEGFILNGKKTKLNGVCEHHDLGALGSAFNRSALMRCFKILKNMGVNAIRTAHNMPAVEFMDLADEMGFLIISEAFDMWERSKTTYDYARFFKEWAEKDIKSWIIRDRNHPSLLLWSIGNEIYDTHADKRGQELTRMLMDYVSKYDPKQNARVTIGSNYMPWENARKCADIVKIAGYNYAEKYYNQHHKEHPDWIIYGSETASVVQSRGVYHFPFEKPILADDDEQCSALGNSSTSWGAKSPEACIIAERDTPFSLGQFIWTGFDYIGEPTPYHTKNSYFGQIDTATFEKDSYYIYKAAWTDYKTDPMVHIFPYWDFNEGQMIDVRVCSNAPRIELLFNDKQIGAYDIDHKNGTQLLGWWKIPYKEGELKAIAYDENGNIIATDIRKSFKDARKICLDCDKDKVMANGLDLAFLEITVEDENGNTVENANNRIHVSVTGEGRLIGLDNGDSTDYDQYKGLSRRLFNGKLMAIIAPTLNSGKIQIEVTGKGLESEKLQLEAIKSEDKENKGIIVHTKNKEMPCTMGSYDEIPLRKIEIISKEREFNKLRKEINVQTKLYPENTTYKELEWSVVNDIGVASNIAKIEAKGDKAKIIALGDGVFRVRCMSKNGTDKIKLISELEFKSTDLGIAYKNPYEFISAGLYDYSKGEIGNGNERGVATARDGETQVGFRGIDFGPYGSDSITIPIFALSSEAYDLQIWEGMPEEEGSMLLADVIYQKETKWNVYQEETYQLSKRLKGITSICFILNQKVHIKGFYFEKKNRAFGKNMALECEHIYGDTFTIKDDCVKGIGNNVSLEFNEMDFTDKGIKRIRIFGKSPIDKNTIHIRFNDGKVDNSQIVEFMYSDDYEEQVFDLEKITGVQKVTFVFLPGSNFDFGWFRFE